MLGDDIREKSVGELGFREAVALTQWRSPAAMSRHFFTRSPFPVLPLPFLLAFFNCFHYSTKTFADV